MVKNYFNIIQKTFYNFLAVPFNISPCTPSPCGFNAICKEQNGVGSCICSPDYIGNPYEGCRPECVIDTDCPSALSCIRSKCQDPCPGTCGTNAECRVINHRPACTCIQGYSGNPFQYCTLMREIGTEKFSYAVAIRWKNLSSYIFKNRTKFFRNSKLNSYRRWYIQGSMQPFTLWTK